MLDIGTREIKLEKEGHGMSRNMKRCETSG